MSASDTRPVRQPGPDHPITIEPAAAVVTARLGGAFVGRTEDALVLREQGYPPVLYLPPVDLDQWTLQESDHTTWCPYKGEARYWHVVAGEDRAENAAWAYPDALPAVAEIADRVAFDVERVDVAADPPVQG